MVAMMVVKKVELMVVKKVASLVVLSVAMTAVSMVVMMAEWLEKSIVKSNLLQVMTLYL